MKMRYIAGQKYDEGLPCSSDRSSSLSNSSSSNLSTSPSPRISANFHAFLMISSLSFIVLFIFPDSSTFRGPISILFSSSLYLMYIELSGSKNGETVGSTLDTRSIMNAGNTDMS